VFSIFVQPLFAQSELEPSLCLRIAPSAAHGTPIARVDDSIRPSFPLVSFLAAPLQLGPTTCELRRQTFSTALIGKLPHVFNGVPPGLLACAHRAPSPHWAGPICDHGFPAVSFCAAPPCLLARAGSEVRRVKTLVLLSIPLIEQFGVFARQTIGARSEPSVAVWTAAPRGSACHDRLPFVLFIAAPPDFSVRMRPDIFRTKIAVLVRMPFSCQVGVD
jgi:hypothetical protein